MNKGKILKLWVLPVALLVSSAGIAQDNQAKESSKEPQAVQVQDSKTGNAMTPEQKVEMRVKRLTEKLNLTEDQQKKLKELFTAQDKSMRDGANRDERRESRQKMMDDLNKILTPEQQAKMKEMLEAQKQKRMEKQSMQKDDEN